MRLLKITLVLAMMGISSPSFANTLADKVPSDIRRACESDVRKLCVRKGSTEDQVLACVKRKFEKLNSQCKIKLTKAGF